VTSTPKPTATETPTVIYSPTATERAAIPAEWVDRIDHIETLPDGRVVAIAAPTVDGQEAVRRVLQLNEKGEWVPYQAQVAGIMGLPTAEEIRNRWEAGETRDEMLGLESRVRAIEVVGLDDSENPAYPLFRDADGNVLTGMLAYTSDYSRAFVSGRIAGGFTYRDGELWLGVFDVPLGTGDVERFVIANQYMHSPKFDDSQFFPLYYFEGILGAVPLTATTLPVEMGPDNPAIAMQSFPSGNALFAALVGENGQLNPELVGAPIGLVIGTTTKGWEMDSARVENDITADLLAGRVPDGPSVRFDFLWIISSQQFGLGN
jgi:hypothetical protein